MTFRDVTNRREVEREHAALLDRERAAHQEAEMAVRQLHLALEAGRMGTFEYVLRSGAVKWSAALEAIHGYAPGTFPGTAEAYREEIHPDDRERVLEAIRRAVDQRQEHHIEYRIVRTDGAVRWVEGRGQVLLDENQEPDRIIGVCSDITERKQNEQILTDQANLLGTIDDAMYEVDSEIRITDWSPAAERLYGYSPSEAIGRHAPDLLRPNVSPAQRAEFVKRLERGEIVRFEAQLHRKDGRPVWVNLTAVAKRDTDGVVRRIVAVHRDVSEVRRAGERFRLAIEAAPTAMFLVDQRGSIVLANALAEQLLGCTREELVGESVDRFVPPAARERHAAHRAAFFAESRPRPMGVGRELFAVRKSGEKVPVEVGLSPIETSDGLFVLAAVTDITERKAIEAERERLLERERRAREELERASRLKDQFLAALSHELRTPLSAVLGYAHLLTSGRLSEERAAHAAEAIERNARAQARLVESLLDLSRIIADKFELDIERVDVSSLVSSAVDVVRPDAEAKRIQIDVSAPRGIALEGDRGRLEQVLWNLLANAVKFTPTDGRIAVCVTRTDRDVCIAVSDNGRGISPDFLPYIFDRFKQARDGDQPAKAGLGLGLALVREIVEAHRGSVVADSPGPGGGSSFTVTLPLEIAAAERLVTRHALISEAAALPPGTDVLVVDDQTDARELLAITLRSHGATVRAAASAAEALEEIASRRPDVLLADLRMPDQDGYYLVAKVRELERGHGLRRLPAVAVTASSEDLDRGRPGAAGYDSHLVKPVDPNDLVRVVARLARAERV